MKERIILAPGANGAELTKSLAAHGINCFALRIVGAGELARMAMMHSGLSVAEDFVNSREETAIVAEAAAGNGYFRKTKYSDIREIAGAIRQMRSLVTGADEEAQIEKIMAQGIFEEKNAALISIYKKYMKILADRKLTDCVSIIRKASLQCSPMDAEFTVLEEYPPNPLELALLEKVSGGAYRTSCLNELFGLTDVSVKITDFKNCYGAPNEVETILADIYSNNSIDTCTVAVTDPTTYGQLFFDYALLYNLPVTFGCGIPVINSNPAKLLVLYYHWMTGGFFGAAAVSAMLASDVFDRQKLSELYPEADGNFSRGVLSEMLGKLRLENDKTVNDARIKDLKKAVEEEKALTDPKDEKAWKKVMRKLSCIPFLEVLARELALPAEDFIMKYSRIRKGSSTNSERLLMMLDTSAARAICDELKVMRAAGQLQATEDMIENVLRMGVGASSSEQGSLFVTGIDGAMTTVRDNLYIAGLSSSNYPGSPREHYLLLDSDLELFGDGAEPRTSEGKIGRKRDRLLKLARLFSGMSSSVHVSFAGLNVSELKADNPSSLVYELYREESGRSVTAAELDEHITKVAYFEPAISVTRKVGDAYNEGKVITPVFTERKGDKAGYMPDLEREYSPSALDSFFGCQRAFMLSQVLGIPSPEDDDPFEVIASKQSGTMAHELMEKLADSNMTLEEFLELSGQWFDRFVVEHPPLVAHDAEAERGVFLDMMESAYNMDPHRETVLKEEDIHCVHETGVKIHGYPDRVEKLDDGSYLIVDFKSGRTVVHEEDDIETCLQVMIYAYLMEKKGYNVSGAEYRYIRLGKTVTCRYDDEMKARLANRLSEFRRQLEEAEFPVSPYAIARTAQDPDPCRFCKFGMICGKNSGKEDGANV